MTAVPTGERAALQRTAIETAEDVRAIKQALWGPPERPNGLVGDFAKMQEQLALEFENRRKNRTVIIIAVISGSFTVLAALVTAAAVVLSAG